MEDLKVGAKVRWFDPDPEGRDLTRIYIIDNINGEVISISDEYGEAEVFENELELVKD